MFGFTQKRPHEQGAASSVTDSSSPKSMDSGAATDDRGRSNELMQSQRQAYNTRRELLSLSDALAGELEGTVGQVEKDGDTVNTASADLAAAIADVHTLADTLTQDAAKTSANAEDLSSKAETLNASSGLISERVGQALSKTGDAVAKMEEATEVVRNLSQASAKIGDIVQLIQDIANQTNLLALNATIEAARAGEAGRGFAVVANEVKALAGQTASATTEIGDQISEIQSVTEAAVSALGEIGAAISGVEKNSNEVSEAVADQHEAISGIGRIASETLSISEHLASSVDQIASKAGAAETLSESQKQTAGNMADGISALSDRLNIAIAATRQGTGETASSIPFDLTASLDVGDRSHPCRVSSLTKQSATLQCGGTALPAGARVTIKIPALGDIAAEVTQPSDDGYLVLLAADPATDQAIDHFNTRCVGPDQPVIAVGMDAAERIQHVFQRALDEGTLSADDLFDESYQTVDGSDPPQHLTRFTAFTDKELPAIQEPAMESHDAIIFCAAVDRNGYLPTHNLKYCHPQKPDDPVWNAANCRNHRIFNDRTGLAAGRNTEPFLVQSYLRDMGGGNYVLMKDLSVPIYVGGRHWGGVRVGYKL